MSTVKWNLKEAGGKHSGLRTETAYKARCMGDAAKQAKAPYCTEMHNVNAEATRMESGCAYPERSDNNPAEIGENINAETGVRANNNITAIIRSQQRS